MKGGILRYLISHRYGPELMVFGLGALAFLLHSLQPREASLAEDQHRIIMPAAGEISRGTVWVSDAVDAEPTQADLEEWLHGEVLYREALRLGLDKGDIIVRRRLIQKMEYLLDGMADIPELNAGQLEEYYREHGERYRRQARYSFNHFFFDGRGGLESAQERARHALSKIESASQSGVWPAVGDPFPDGTEFEGITVGRVQRLFGEEFLQAIDESTKGDWAGPYHSRYGVHLVYVYAIQPSVIPPLEDVYTAVARDYIEYARQRQSEEYYARIEERYEIVAR